jgi:hypothetical protein
MTTVKVRFAAAVVARVAVVAGAVVDHFEPGRQERFLQQDFDLACYGSAHRMIPGVFMRRAYHHCCPNAPRQIPWTMR